LKKAKRIVIKIGASVLTTKGLTLDEVWIKDFATQVSSLSKQGREIVIVSSGAIASGMGLLGIKKRPRSLPEQQACAAVGQGYLMKIYESYFNKNGFHAAQILLTWEDIRERRRYLNAENTLHALLARKVIPVINENDTVSVDEIKFGDNDKLSALVANIISADLLIMLTDVDGLYIDEKKTVASVVKKLDAGIEKIACGTDKECSQGGMRTKLDAVKIAVNSGIDCVIANGRHEDVILGILNGKKIGTLFLSGENKMQAKKRWIAYNARSQGRIFVDDGAKEALIKKNKSLLLCGVKKVEGTFIYGDVVMIADLNGNEFAKGLSNYSAGNLDKIKGMKTKEAEKIISEDFYEEAVHRDNLVIL
jgi:glutamate 5-kinase